LFTLQWYIENCLAPILVCLTCEFLMWFFVQIGEHIKKPHFFIDIYRKQSYIVLLVYSRAK